MVKAPVRKLERRDMVGKWPALDRPATSPMGADAAYSRTETEGIVLMETFIIVFLILTTLLFGYAWANEKRRNDDIIILIEQARSLFKNCSVESGDCMCGDYMKTHSGPMHSGHSPQDSGAYYASKWLEYSERKFPSRPIDLGDL